MIQKQFINYILSKKLINITTLGIPENIDVNVLHLKDLVKSNQGEQPQAYIFVIENDNQFAGLISLNLG